MIVSSSEIVYIINGSNSKIRNPILPKNSQLLCIYSITSSIRSNLDIKIPHQPTNYPEIGTALITVSAAYGGIAKYMTPLANAATAVPAQCTKWFLKPPVAANRPKQRAGFMASHLISQEK